MTNCTDKDKLLKILLESPIFTQLFDRADRINLPDWYIAGGCLTQTVWNHHTGRSWNHGIKDVDIVYFKKGAETALDSREQERVSKLFEDLEFSIDLQNEANVHTWYEEKFGDKIEPYVSVEQGIRTWLPAFAVGVRKEMGRYKIFAPYGLDDLFGQTVRPNKIQISESIYAKMVSRLKKDWPEISVSPW